MVPEDPRNRVSVRIRILIKNMFDNKAKNWEKSKNENTQIKKKAEIANEVIEKRNKDNLEIKESRFADRITIKRSDVSRKVVYIQKGTKNDFPRRERNKNKPSSDN